jgi:aspartyl-tRNA(Asn)/glutamyl-tRNA(Gln) amidotransferase subunit C
MISEKDVKHIADLARLGLNGKELKKYQKDLSSILDYIEKLGEVDVSGVEATSHPGELKNVFRKDERGKGNGEVAERIIESAPDKEGRYIKVKPILKRGK